MTHRLKPQPGFALPLLLILLTFGAIGSMAAVSVAMQQAKTTSILNASIEAIHAAESGGAYMVTAGSVPNNLPDGVYEGEALSALSQHFPTAAPGWPMGPGRWWVERLAVSGQTVTLRVIGEDGAGRTSRRIEVTYTRSETSEVFPFSQAVLGCNGISLSGSTTIESYDSRLGPYGGSNRGSNAGVAILDGNLTLSGSTRIRGDLFVGGNLEFSGSAGVENGRIQATGNMNFSGNPYCPDDLVQAGGSITWPSWWCQTASPNFQQGVDLTPPVETCDPLNASQFVGDRVQRMSSEIGSRQSGDYSGWRANNPTVFTGDANFVDRLHVKSTNEIIFDSETVDQVFVNNSFELGGSGKVRIRAPTTPGADGVVRIYVNGDVDFGGGAQFIIEDGAAVEFYVTGKVSLGAGLTNQNNSPTIAVGDSDVAPSFAIFSSYEGPNGVNISGSSQIFASVYAPNTGVTVSGSGGLYGAVRAGTVNLAGSGGVRFDDALSGVSTGTVTETGGARVTVWNEV